MEFYRCNHCGNLAVLLNNSGAPLSCCGEDMSRLEAGVTDAAREKHIPDVTVNGGQMHVRVGETAHPMLPAHSIQWILLRQGSTVQYATLAPDSPPQADFAVQAGPYEVYEYCNLHGLWKKEGAV